MNITDAVILGAVQGVTEFLPVSSSGHLVIAQHLIKEFEQPGVLFDVILHFGTLFAIVIYFYRDIVTMLRDLFRSNEHYSNKAAILIIAGSFPTGIIGVLFQDVFEEMFHSVRSVAVMLIITGSILFLTRLVKGNNRKKLNILDAILIGITQGIAIIPGISRSGITISTGIFRGIDAETVGRFSFLLSIPAIMGAVVLQSRHISSLDINSLPPYLTGAFTAFLTGLLSIRLLMTVLKSGCLSRFAFYCWGVGSIAFFI